MTNGEPTLGEVLRRLDEVSRQMSSLALQMAQDRRDAAATFVSRELYDARHSSLTRRVETLEKDVEEKEKSDADSRRQILFIILAAVLTAVLSLIVSIVLASGGALS